MVFNNKEATEIVKKIKDRLKAVGSDDNNPSIVQTLYGDLYSASIAYLNQSVRYFAWGNIDEHSLEDLVHDSFIKLVESLGRFDGRVAPLHTWVTTLVKHRVMTFFRKKNRKRQVTLIDNMPSVGEAEASLLGRVEDTRTDAYYIDELIEGDVEDLIRQTLPFYLATENIADIYELLKKSQFHYTRVAKKRLLHYFEERTHINLLEYNEDVNETLISLIAVFKIMLTMTWPEQLETLVEAIDQRRGSKEQHYIDVIAQVCGSKVAAKLAVMFGNAEIRLDTPEALIFRHVAEDT